tara:strand:+ start:748 stop:1041 length:294 start_codon:yes stop_codon:yes gene_type:complete
MNKFLHKNNIKLYLANSDGWNVKIPKFIHLPLRDEIKLPSNSGNIIKNKSINIEEISNMVDKFVKYLKLNLEKIKINPTPMIKWVIWVINILAPPEL